METAKNLPISMLPFGNKLTGVELIPVVQDGQTRHRPVSDLMELVDGGTGGILSVADVAALKLVDTTSATDYPDRKVAFVEAEQVFYFLDRGETTLVEDTSNYKYVVDPTVGDGRWIKHSIKDLELYRFSSLAQRETFFTNYPLLKAPGKLASVLGSSLISELTAYNNPFVPTLYSSGPTVSKIYVPYFTENKIAVYDALTRVKIKELTTPHSNPYKVVIGDNKLYVLLHDGGASTGYVWILNAADEAVIAEVACVGLPYDGIFTPYGVYIGGSGSGLTLINRITNAVTTYPITGRIDPLNSMKIYGNYDKLFKGNIIDFKIDVVTGIFSASPIIAASIDLPTVTLPKGMAIYGSKLFVAVTASDPANRKIYIFDANTYESLGDIAYNREAATSFIYIVGNKLVIGFQNSEVSGKGTVAIFDADTETLLSEVTTDSISFWIEPAGNGRILVSNNAARNLQLIDVNSGSIVNVIDTNGSPLSPRSFLMLPNNTIALSEASGSAGVLSFRKITTTGVFKLKSDNVTWEDFPNGILGISATNPGDAGIDNQARSAIAELEEKDTLFDGRILALENAGTSGRFTFDGTVGTWAIGDVVYRTGISTWAVASANSIASALMEGIIVDLLADDVNQCVGVGGKLSANDLANLAGAGITINAEDKYYLSLTGKPTLTPPTGYLQVQKEIISNGGVVVEKEAEEIGLDEEKVIEFTATGTFALQVGVKEYLLIGNSATPITITIPTVTASNAGVKFSFGNKGAGTITTSAIRGSARTVAQDAKLNTIVDLTGAIVII